MRRTPVSGRHPSVRCAIPTDSSLRDTDGVRRPAALLVVAPGTEGEQVVTIVDRVVVGRECRGVRRQQRLLVDDPTVSRHHFEIRLAPGRAELVDLSTNGTKLNGRRVERAVPTRLKAGDRLRIGKVELEFHGTDLDDEEDRRGNTTQRRFTDAPMFVVAGDIIDSTAITRAASSSAVAGAIDELFGELRLLIADHGGSTANLAGDAILGVWDEGDDPGATVEQVVGFTQAAVEHVARRVSAAGDDDPHLAMGWGVTFGSASLAVVGSYATQVLGEPVALACRLAGLAGRGTRPAVLASSHPHLDPRASGKRMKLRVKGWAAPTDVYALAVADHI